MSVNDLFKRKQCKAFTEKGVRCSKYACLGGYCTIHYRIMLGRIPVECRSCELKNSCELLKRGDTSECRKRRSSKQE